MFPLNGKITSSPLNILAYQTEMLMKDIEEIKATLKQNGCDWERVGEYMMFSDQKSSILATYIIYTNYSKSTQKERWGWIYYGCERSGLFYTMDASRFEKMILESFATSTKGKGKTSHIRKSISAVRTLMETEITMRITGQKGFELEQTHQKCQNIAETLKKYCTTE